MNPSIAKAGFFPRLSAFLVDVIIMGILLFMIKAPVALFELAYPDAFIFHDFIFEFNIFDIAFYFIQLAYFVCFTSFAGTTLGKALFNLAVVDEEGKKLTFFNALYRESIGKYLSGILNLGYLMIFVDKNRRGFHDYLCDSYVIYTCKMREVKKVIVERVYQDNSMIPKSNPIPQSTEEENLWKEQNEESKSEIVSE